MKYRHDIDGLRALSVIMVILNHLGFPWCGGGYVGVDVFFVISGYVITQHLAKEASSGTFSIAGFYERRIRRLLPGLAAVVALVVMVAWRIMLPEDFRSLTNSVASASLAASNVYFWRQSGYFDVSSITKPMLHTWSLAVEEQFYFIYPLLFACLHKAGKKLLLPVLGLLVAASFTLASFLVHGHPIPTFFLLPTRLWEMLVGGVVFLAFVPFRPSKGFGALLSCGGLGLIAVASTMYSDRTPFPGITALLPTCGAVLFILAGQAEHKTAVFKVMTWTPVLCIGKISYLLYLTHWPIIVLWTYLKISNLGLLDKFLIIIISISLSVAIYVFAERPFRSRAILPQRWHAYTAATAFFLLCCALGYAGYSGKGYPGRFTAGLRTVSGAAKELSQDDSIMRGVIPYKGTRRLDGGHVDPDEVGTFGGNGPADMAVFGDSHALHLFDGFVSEAQRRGHRVKFFVKYFSPPVLDLSSWNEGGVRYNEEVVSLLCKDVNIKEVILASNWTMYLKGGVYLPHQSHLLQLNGKDVSPSDAEATMRTHLTRTLERLRANGKSVYVLEPLPESKLDILNTLRRCTVFGRDAYDYIDTSMGCYMDRHATTLELLRRAAADSGTTVIPIAEALWSGNRFMIEENGTSLFIDYHHLSPSGSRRVAPFIFNRIYASERQ